MSRRYVFFIIAFAVAALEIVLRIMGINDTYLERIGKKYYTYWGKKHAGWHHTGRPNITYTEKNIDFSYESRTNSLGLRELEAEQVFGMDNRRVILLGDSYTEGVGVVYDSSFARHLSAIADSYRTPLSFYNAGVSGSDPLFGYTLLRDKLLQYHPDIVIQTINPSDYTDLIYRGGFERFKPDTTTVFRAAPFFEPLYHYSYIFRFALHRYLGYVPGDLFMKEADFFKACEALNRQFIEVADSFQSLAAKSDIKILFVLHSGNDDLAYDDDRSNLFFKNLMKQLGHELSRRGNLTINIWEYMDAVINRDNRLIYGFEHDGHFSSAGYRLMAKAIWEETEKNYPGFWNGATAGSSPAMK